MNDRTLPAVVLGLSPTGLIAIRSLGRQGIPVYGADLDHWGIGRFSRYCSYRSDLTEASRKRNGEVLCEALVDLARELGSTPVLYVTNDTYIELLSPWATELEAHFLLSTDLAKNGLRFLDKRLFYGLCRKHDEELPATYFPENYEAVRDVADRISFPAILKPAHIHRFTQVLRGKKVVQAFDSESLLRGYNRLSSVDTRVIVQEVVPGPDSAIQIAACYVDDQRQDIFVGRKIRQYPPRFGSACLAESAWDSEVAERSLRFLRSVGFRGICGTEYKRDPRDGRLKMIEINPRLTLWMGLAAATGVDVARIAYERLTGGVPSPADQVDGLKWAYLIRDFQSALYYIARRELSPRGWMRSFRGLVREAVLAKDDLAIGWRLPAYAAARMMRRFR